MTSSCSTDVELLVGDIVYVEAITFNPGSYYTGAGLTKFIGHLIYNL